MKVLVAGCGNIFLGDDGFGGVVARRLASDELPNDVVVADFGVGGIHLACDITGGYTATILVDAIRRGGRPGTLYVIEPCREHSDTPHPGCWCAGVPPDAVRALEDVLGDAAGDVLIVGCEPADSSPGMGLSPPVNDAVGMAADLVLDLIRERLSAQPVGREESG